MNKLEISETKRKPEDILTDRDEVESYITVPGVISIMCNCTFIIECFIHTAVQNTPTQWCDAKVNKQMRLFHILLSFLFSGLTLRP